MLQVKIFDEENEQDLMFEVNKFLKKLDENNFVDIKYSLSSFLTSSNEQVYCYSALILYKDMIK